VDGTDCPIQEPEHPINPRWHSHKLNASGVRYELGVCIQTGLIVWVNGPYPAGPWVDIRIFRHRMVGALATGEWVVGDEGYRDGLQFVLNKRGGGFPGWWKSMAAKVCSKHEWVNSQIKKFRIMRVPFRNEIGTHGDSFMAIASVVQIQLMLSEPYQEYVVHYDDRGLFTDNGTLIEQPNNGHIRAPFTSKTKVLSRYDRHHI